MARILVVEDEMLVRELAAEDLEDAGHQTVTAADGDEALKIIEADGAFDCLFTDIRMPGTLDGWQLAEAVRQRVPGIQVIYASGLTDAAPRLDGERILFKPYTPQALLGLING